MHNSCGDSTLSNTERTVEPNTHPISSTGGCSLTSSLQEQLRSHRR
uniref:Uncharacterized protein n=1 Tax=Aegilops tauschii subsp. strangulata TaxID=200361 RepID=A0A452Z051_AEGTS